VAVDLLGAAAAVAATNTIESGKAPTDEIGSVTAYGYGAGVGVSPWGIFIDVNELVPQLRFPTSVQTYEHMRSDAQLTALHLAATMPIQRYRWMINPNGADPKHVAHIATDWNLPTKGEDDEAKPRPRTAGRFSFESWLYHALLASQYGFMFFEQVGYISDADGLWHMRKLAPRMPRTIFQIHQDPVGELTAVQQSFGIGRPPIPANRLVPMVWHKEGGSWIGRSMLRPCYRHWLRKDDLLRTDVVLHRRAGGVPVAEGMPGASKEQLAELAALAQNFRVGENAGGAVPSGAKLSLISPTKHLGVTAIDSARYDDQAMSKAYLAQFLELGQTETGSRALGSEFIDFFALAQEATGKWVVDGANAAIERQMDWSYGEDTAYCPQLVFEREDDPSETVGDLVALIAADAIVADDELEDSLRARFGLPPRDPSTARADADTNIHQQTIKANRRRAQIRSAKRVRAAGDANLPDRPLRREPTEHELAAGVDYRALDTAWQTAVDALTESWAPIKQAQIDELTAQIRDASSTTDFAGLQATPKGADLLERHMTTLAEVGVSSAQAEATHQGVTLPDPVAETVTAGHADRAAAVEGLLARSISEAAARKATQYAGGALDNGQIADQVDTYLSGLSDTYLTDQFGGALTSAINDGRFSAMDGAPDGTRFEASELLDSNTCDPCSLIDGTEYESLADLTADYSAGGYNDCDGGSRCRGTGIAIYATGAGNIE